MTRHEHRVPVSRPGGANPGFLHRLPDHPAVAATLAEFSAALGQDILALDGEQALRSTVAVQIATVAAGVAVARMLAERGAEPDFVAGSSVGAYAAAIVGGAVSLADALPLVRLRGELMERAYPRGYGLAAVVGVFERRLDALVAAAFDPAAPVYLANLDAPTQFVIAGAEAGLDKVLEAARAEGARKAEHMAVGVPSHCPLLAKVADTLGGRALFCQNRCASGGLCRQSPRALQPRSGSDTRGSGRKRHAPGPLARIHRAAVRIGGAIVHRGATRACADQSRRRRLRRGQSRGGRGQRARNLGCAGRSGAEAGSGAVVLGERARGGKPTECHGANQMEFSGVCSGSSLFVLLLRAALWRSRKCGATWWSGKWKARGV